MDRTSSLLVAIMIISWSKAEAHRLDQRNHIALNPHDKAFDLGPISFDQDLRLVCAPSLRDQYPNGTVSLNFEVFEGMRLASPSEAAGPKAEYLE